MKNLSISMTDSERWGAWVYLFIDIFFLPAAINLLNAGLSQPLSDAVTNFLYFLINFISLTVICRRFLIKSLKSAVAEPFLCLKTAFFGFLLLRFLQFAIGYITILLLPDYVNQNDQNIAKIIAQNPVLVRIGVIALVPLAEEVLFRGLIFRELYGKNKVAAYLVSSAAFCAIHLIQYLPLYDPITLLFSFLQYLPAGLCLGWAYVKADTIVAPILIHIAVNQIGMSII